MIIEQNINPMPGMGDQRVAKIFLHAQSRETDRNTAFWMVADDRGIEIIEEEGVDGNE